MMVTSKVIMRRANVRFTYRDYLLLPEGKRYEILDGDLYVVPAPNIRHQRVSRRLGMALVQHIESNSLGEAFYAPCDTILSDENVLQPDLLFVRKERSGIIGELNLQGPPDLVIEILSTGTRSRDLDLKRKIYGGFGVGEYWIVDPDMLTVEVLVLSDKGYITAANYGKSDRLSSPLLPDFNLPLAQVFL